MKITVGTAARPARVAFAKGLFEASAFGGDPGAKADYNTKFIIEPDHPVVAQLMAAEEAVAKEKWGGKADAILAQIRAKGQGVVQDGNTQQSDGFAGMKFVSARSQTRPTVVNRDRSPITQQDGIVYSGCYGIAIVQVWAQDNSYGKRINAQLTGFQFVKDGDSFGGGVPAAAADEFEALSAEGDDADPFA